MSESEEDEIAGALGKIMIEREKSFEPSLERYAAGQLSDDERAALELRAASDPELARALEAHRPLSPEFHARLGAAVKSALDERPSDSVASHQSNLRVLRARAPVIAAVLAAAAAALFFVIAKPTTSANAPRYTLVARAGDAEWRGEHAVQPERHVVREDSLLELILRPDHPAETHVEAALYVVQNGQRTRSSVPAEISRDGAVRFLARANELSGTRTGTVTFVLEVGEAGGDTWQSSSLEVLIRPLAAGS